MATRSSPYRTCALLMTATFVLGCGSKTPDTGVDAAANPSDAMPGEATGFTLQVASTVRITRLGGAPAAAGKVFIIVEGTLRNVSASVPVPVGLANFSLESTEALVFPAHPRSSLLKPTCPSNVAIAQGGAVTCKLAFEVATTVVPARLRYSDLNASAPREGTSMVPAITPIPNVLGVVCGAMAGPCPADSESFCYFPGKFGSDFGSATEGYCTQRCASNDDPVCHDGYVGPTTGASNVCNLGDQACLIKCTEDAQCPTSLKCLPPPGALIRQCAYPNP